MKSLVRIAPVIALCVVMVAACNRNAPSNSAQTAPASAPVATAPTPASPQAPPPIPPGTEVPVSSIDSVMLNRPQDAPEALIIQVSGTTPSSGWTNAHLAEDAEPGSDPSVRTYKFIATSPEAEQPNGTPQMVEAELRVESLPPQVKSIRVISATNEISAPVTD